MLHIYMYIYWHYVGCFTENCDWQLVWLYLLNYVAMVTLSTFLEIWQLGILKCVDHLNLISDSVTRSYTLRLFCGCLKTFSYIFLPEFILSLHIIYIRGSLISKNSTMYLSALINRLKPSGKHVYLLICHMKQYIPPTRCNVHFYMEAIFSFFRGRNWFFVLFGRISVVTERSLIFWLPVWACLNILR